MRPLKRARSALVPLISMVTILFVAVVIGALVAGYRPVVIQTGSMGDTAPAGSLIIAMPRAGGDVGVGDILIMRRPDLATVTHRVIEVELANDATFAITQGDANESPDATPYPLDSEQLVSRWVLKGWGFRLQKVFEPGIALALVALATLAIAVGQLRRIWREPSDAAPVSRATPEPRRTKTQRRRRAMAISAFPLVAVMTVGVAWAMFQSSEVVASNDFSTSACFDAQVGSVQSGQTIHAVDGVVQIPITPVNPNSSFLLLSTRSSSNRPVGATVRGTLAGGGVRIELDRDTNAGVPSAITVAWSVIEYPCGVSVQRGTATGSGTDRVDIPISTVDSGASFVLVNSEANRTDQDFGADDLFVAELTSATNLRIRSDATVVVHPGRTFSWQVISFDDGADVAIQNVTSTLGVGVTSATILLGTPVDETTTFILGAATSASAGADIGERLIRTHLTSPTSVEVSRQVGGDAIDVNVQVITLKDGSTVRHGTVDFNAGQPTASVTVSPVDSSRSTAISTMVSAGPNASGSTAMVTDDVLGEASATFVLSDPTTVSITRSATSSSASFGWQVIEWGGPQWWDPSYTFRQRIDATTTTAAAPDAYTLPVTIDHAALVTSGLSINDGSDVRIVRWDGTSWTELDRVVDPDTTWDSTTTTLWFRSQDPIGVASTISYWLYFGNGSPGPAADDPENVFLLTEDFESGTLGDFEDRTGSTGWYRAQPWSRRIPVTVPAGRVSSDLTDFPLLVSLTNADLGSNAQADGSDIRFTTSGGAPLAHELERWDPTTGSVTAWVKIPNLTSAAPTTIYLYYGADDAPDQQDIRDVWSDEIEGAWHMHRDPSGTAPQADDSSRRNHDGIGRGSMTGNDLATGLIGDAIDFDGVNDMLEVDPFEVSNTNALTVSGWVRIDSFTFDQRIITKATDGFNRVFELTIRNTGAVRGRFSLDGVRREYVSAPGVVSLGTWHHLVTIWDGSTIRVFVDGIELGTKAVSGSLDSNSTMPVTLGNVASGDRAFDGLLDEVRVETVARSQAWLSASESSQRSPGVFLLVGSAETGSWFEQDTWTYRRPIAIDPDLVPADVADFALLVQVVDTELQAKAQSSGADLVFTAADGVTRLDHVVESYDGSTGTLAAWVRLPKLDSAVPTALFMYYGAPAAFDQQDPVGVFGEDGDLTLLLNG